MILSLGSFEFEALNLESLEQSLDYGVQKQSRINNHAAIFSSSKLAETITLSGLSLPLKKDKNSYLDKLKKMAELRSSYALCGANGKYYGRFIITSINNSQSSFLQGSGFLKQSFSLSLERVF